MSIRSAKHMSRITNSSPTCNALVKKIMDDIQSCAEQSLGYTEFFIEPEYSYCSDNIYNRFALKGYKMDAYMDGQRECIQIEWM